MARIWPRGSTPLIDIVITGPRARLHPSSSCWRPSSRTLLSAPRKPHLRPFPPPPSFTRSFARSATLLSEQKPAPRTVCAGATAASSAAEAATPSAAAADTKPRSPRASFWGSAPVWRRAGVNTLRCLVGCSLGDFSAMWFLQANHPELGTGVIMASSVLAGLASSISLETVFLRLGRDQLTWAVAARTAVGMSFVSMLGMETVQNLVDYHLTGGVVRLDDAQFWAAAAVSMLAGFLAPLPYNYVRLRKYGKACH